MAWGSTATRMCASRNDLAHSESASGEGSRELPSPADSPRLALPPRCLSRNLFRLARASSSGDSTQGPPRLADCQSRFLTCPGQSAETFHRARRHCGERGDASPRLEIALGEAASGFDPFELLTSCQRAFPSGSCVLVVETESGEAMKASLGSVSEHNVQVIVETDNATWERDLRFQSEDSCLEKSRTVGFSFGVMAEGLLRRAENVPKQAMPEPKPALPKISSPPLLHAESNSTLVPAASWTPHWEGPSVVAVCASPINSLAPCGASEDSSTQAFLPTHFRLTARESPLESAEMSPFFTIHFCLALPSILAWRSFISMVRESPSTRA